MPNFLKSTLSDAISIDVTDAPWRAPAPDPTIAPRRLGLGASGGSSRVMAPPVSSGNSVYTPPLGGSSISSLWGGTSAGASSNFGFSAASAPVRFGDSRKIGVSGLAVGGETQWNASSGPKLHTFAHTSLSNEKDFARPRVGHRERNSVPYRKTGIQMPGEAVLADMATPPAIGTPSPSSYIRRIRKKVGNFSANRKIKPATTGSSWLNSGLAVSGGGSGLGALVGGGVGAMYAHDTDGDYLSHVGIGASIGGGLGGFAGAGAHHYGKVRPKIIKSSPLKQKRKERGMNAKRGSRV